MDKSKSGRVRKKPKKFDDFESQDEVPPPVNQIQRQKIRKGKKKVSYLNLEIVIVLQNLIALLEIFLPKHFCIVYCWTMQKKI